MHQHMPSLSHASHSEHSATSCLLLLMCKIQAMSMAAVCKRQYQATRGDDTPDRCLASTSAPSSPTLLVSSDSVCSASFWPSASASALTPRHADAVLAQVRCNAPAYK